MLFSDLYVKVYYVMLFSDPYVKVSLCYVIFRPIRKSLADVWREESGEEENPSLQMQPQSHF